LTFGKICFHFGFHKVWHFIYPSKNSEIVQDPVNKKTQVEQESRKNTKVFHVFNKVFPSISCFWSCISWCFVVFPETYRYFLMKIYVFPGVTTPKKKIRKFYYFPKNPKNFSKILKIVMSRKILKFRYMLLTFSLFQKFRKILVISEIFSKNPKKSQ
jgi:hypothetical protein